MSTRTQQSEGQCLSLHGYFLQQLLFVEMFHLRNCLCAQGFKDRKKHKAKRAVHLIPEGVDTGHLLFASS